MLPLGSSSCPPRIVSLSLACWSNTQLPMFIPTGRTVVMLYTWFPPLCWWCCHCTWLVIIQRQNTTQIHHPVVEHYCSATIVLMCCVLLLCTHQHNGSIHATNTLSFIFHPHCMNHPGQPPATHWIIIIESDLIEAQEPLNYYYKLAQQFRRPYSIKQIWSTKRIMMIVNIIYDN